MVSMDMVEVNPMLDQREEREMQHGDFAGLKGSPTIVTASELILSGVGYSWY
jgi:hypothetical protein